VAIAKEAGFSISADDLKSAQSEASEEELEGVAGGNCSGRVAFCSQNQVSHPLNCLM